MVPLSGHYALMAGMGGTLFARPTVEVDCIVSSMDLRLSEELLPRVGSKRFVHLGELLVILSGICAIRSRW